VLRVALGAALGAGLLLACGAPARAEAPPQTILKIATIAPEGSTWMKLMRELDARVREETGGQVGFKFYPGGQQGSDLDVLRKIRSGQIQGAGLTGVGLGEIEPSLRILELPFMFHGPEEVAVAHQALDATFRERVRQRGFHILGWAEVGFVYLFSQAPVRSVEDLRAQKTWLWEGDPLAQALLEELGVAPVPLNFSDVLTSLQTGIVNTVYVTPYACLSLQWFPRLSYMVDLPLTNAMGAVVVSAEAFDRLTPEQQACVTRIADEIFARLLDATHQQNAEAAAAITGRNIRTLTPDPAAVTAFETVGRRVWGRLVGVLYDRELLDRLTGALEAARRAAGSAP
jgi:TRAP-type C4-dicarboxylate transport system substrate-binding protein